MLAASTTVASFLATHTVEDGINTCIREAAEYAQSDIYQIREESVLSSETLEITNANNAFYVFIKSFIVDVFQNPWEIY